MTRNGTYGPKGGQGIKTACLLTWLGHHTNWGFISRWGVEVKSLSHCQNMKMKSVQNIAGKVNWEMGKELLERDVDNGLA